ncbi:MAG TPA: Ig-like domain-containing protein [Spirochaetota bacterium]|nr:Ig-like domain-containing protein [Spirochaetota bacterium]HSA13768.1 Ig-like domain-containing protein [Spirochaetota bacterium]
MKTKLSYLALCVCLVASVFSGAGCDGDSSSTNENPGGGSVAVTGVSLNMTDASIAIGYTEQLEATITPDNASNKNVIWSSSNPGVASVTDGLVTGVSVGSATISVTTDDGAFSHECEVTVSEVVETTLEYNFMTDGDELVLDSDSDWFFDGGNTGEYSFGYYMNQADIAAPYLFTGDFTVDFQFYLKVLTSEEDDYIFRYAFRLVDPNWEDNSTRRFFDFTAYYTAFPEHDDVYYQIAQGNGSYSCTDYSDSVPGIANGLNTCTIEKEGSTITVYMNGSFVRSATISASNEPSIGYAPFIHGHNSSDQADSNFYLRKVTVTYMSNERVYHNWNE